MIEMNIFQGEPPYELAGANGRDAMNGAGLGVSKTKRAFDDGDGWRWMVMGVKGGLG